jgi:hypothetical protein
MYLKINLLLPLTMLFAFVPVPTRSLTTPTKTTPSCIKAWVNGIQLLGITNTNPITYSQDYCIDHSNAIGYITAGYLPDNPIVVEFWSAVPISTVDQFFASEAQCEFLFAAPSESSWGQFSGQNSGAIFFYFADDSGGLPYGAGTANFTVTDQNGIDAYPSGGHVCPPAGLSSRRCAPSGIYPSKLSNEPVIRQFRELDWITKFPLALPWAFVEKASAQELPQLVLYSITRENMHARPIYEIK